MKMFRKISLLAMLSLAGPLAAQEPGILKELVRISERDGVRIEVRFDGPVPRSAVHRISGQTFYLYIDGKYMARPGTLRVDRLLRPNVEITSMQGKPRSYRLALKLAPAVTTELATADSAIIISQSNPKAPPEPEVVPKTPAPKPQRAAPKPVVTEKRPEDDLPRLPNDGPRISIDFRNADIGNVLRMLARQNGLNIVTNDSVRGKITVTLQNVSVGQALESILSANGYNYVLENGIILVKSADEFGAHEMESRVFRLKYANAYNIVEALADLLSGEGKTKVMPMSFHNKEDVESVNEKVVPERDQKYWLRSSVLLVTDFPANLRMVAAAIAELDVPVPQVMIEARLVETSPRDNTSIGIDWSKSISAEIFEQILLPGAQTHRFSSQTPLPDGKLTLGTLNTSQFNAVLNFLKSQTNTRLVSNPRILAMDNEPSDISVGTNFPIPQITRGVGGQGDVVTFSYRDINITLRVTPHVIDDSTLTMYVNPIIEEITGQVVVESNSAPITSNREVDTVLKVRNGETIAIGGMISEKEIVQLNKVWLLGDLPLIGNLFRNRSTERQQVDLLIFITPTIQPVGTN